MPFEAFEVSLELIASLKVPLARMHGELADQLRRAAISVPLNLAEGRRRVGKDRLHCWRIAAGSADETRAALRIAVAFGQLDDATVAAPLALVDRVLAMTWRMTHK